MKNVNHEIEKISHIKYYIDSGGLLRDLENSHKEDIHVVEDFLKGMSEQMEQTLNTLRWVEKGY